MGNIKISAFDQLGYLMVGGITVLLIILDIFLVSSKNIVVNQDPIVISVVFIFISYFVGHAVQSIAYKLIKREDLSFSVSEKNILKEAKTTFLVKGMDDFSSYRLILLDMHTKDLTGQVSAFNSYLTLYRGWCTMLILEALFLAMYLFYHLLSFNFSYIVFCLLILSLLLSYTLYVRYKLFCRYLKERVFNSYLLTRTL